MTEKLWCAICGEETDHKSGSCPKLEAATEDDRDPEMCIHALSVNDDRDVLCMTRSVMCDGPCKDYDEAW